MFHYLCSWCIFGPLFRLGRAPLYSPPAAVEKRRLDCWLYHSSLMGASCSNTGTLVRFIIHSSSRIFSFHPDSSINVSSSFFIISSTLLTHTQYVKIRDFSLNPCLLFLFIPKCYYNGQYIN